jgi:hypothetical protein
VVTGLDSASGVCGIGRSMSPLPIRGGGRHTGQRFALAARLNAMTGCATNGYYLYRPPGIDQYAARSHSLKALVRAARPAVLRKYVKWSHWVSTGSNGRRLAPSCVMLATATATSLGAPRKNGLAIA